MGIRRALGAAGCTRCAMAVSPSTGERRESGAELPYICCRGALACLLHCVQLRPVQRPLRDGALTASLRLLEEEPWCAWYALSSIFDLILGMPIRCYFAGKGYRGQPRACQRDFSPYLADCVSEYCGDD
jgi:hypothetical protein